MERRGRRWIRATEVHGQPHLSGPPALPGTAKCRCVWEARASFFPNPNEDNDNAVHPQLIEAGPTSMPSILNSSKHLTANLTETWSIAAALLDVSTDLLSPLPCYGKTHNSTQRRRLRRSKSRPCFSLTPCFRDDGRAW